MERFALEDLVSPLSATEFITGHWDCELPHLGVARDGVVERLRSDPVLGCVETLIPRLTRDVILFGPDQFRAPVSAGVALSFLDNGYNLYIPELATALPESAALFHEVARGLGVAPWQVYVEAFAGCRGGVSTRHFDQDVNFQILIEGKKVWRIERNVNIQNPLLGYHPARQRDGSQSALEEEAHAISRDVAADFTDRVVELPAKAGTVMFLPRGYWHEVHSRSKTWSLNLVIKGITWARALGDALTARLNRLPEFRAYCDGLTYGTDAADEERSARSADRFAALKAVAVEALGALGHAEASLASIRSRYRWAPRAAARELVLRDGVHYLCVPAVLDEPLEVDDATVIPLQALLALRGSFSWGDVQTMTPELGPVEMRNMLDELIELDLVELM